MRTIRRQSKLFRGAVSVMLSVIIPFTTMPTVALALPRGGHVTKGTATLSYATNKLLINQSTSTASFSWTGFNVGSAQSVTYKTPGASSVSMNFIGGTTPAVISGKVTSNGVLYFMDANGLVFGSGSTVSASGVRAYGSTTPGGNLTGSVSNAGTIEVTPGGTVALVGSSVANSGTITAPSGSVILASGSTVTLSDTGSSSLSVATTGGGSVTDSGILSAENVDGTPGTIVMKAGMTSGTVTLASSAVLDASAPYSGNGGNITIDASGVALDNVTPLNVSSASGIKGTVTIDPNYILSGTTLDIYNATGLEYLDTNQPSYLSDTINLEGNMYLGGSYSWKPLGNSSTPFTGTFNGKGFVVSGYTVVGTSPDTFNTAGFVGDLGPGGKIENLGVTGAVSGSSSNSNQIYVGGLVGANTTNGTIKNSYATGNVTGLGSHSDVGGLVGFNCGHITNSSATGSVSRNGIRSSSSIGLSDSASGFGVGSLVGFNYYGTITGSYSFPAATSTTIRFTPPIDSLYPMETSLPFTGFARNMDLSPPTVRSGSGLVENTTSPFPGNGAIILISDETSETPASPEPQAMVKKDPLKNDVYFAFDKALLTPEDKMILKKDASILKTHPEANLIIEGHADERGSDTYNIVLGQKRAQATKLYLIRLGVSVNRIKIVSYGKREIPDLRTCSGHSESCWSKNRLVHLR